MRRAILSRTSLIWRFTLLHQSHFPLNSARTSITSERHLLYTNSETAVASDQSDSRISPPYSSNEAYESTSYDNSYSDAADEQFPSETSDVLVEEDHEVEDSACSEDKEHVMEIDVEKLEAVLSLLQSTMDEYFERTLGEMNLSLNEELIVKILQTPFVPAESLIRFLNWVSSDFSVTSRILEAAADAICGNQNAKDAYLLLDFVKKAGNCDNEVLNPRILNKMIAIFSKLGKAKAGFQVFECFGDFGCVPNEDTYFLTIQALCKRRFFDWAWPVCEKMLDVECLPGDVEIGRIITWFCRGKMAKEAHMVYSAGKNKNKILSLVSVNYLVYSLCRIDDLIPFGAEILKDFSDEKRKHAIKSFSSVVHGLCRIKDIDGAKKVLYRMIDAGPPPGNHVFNMIINSLCKAGDLVDAMQMVKLMEKRGLKPDVYTYTVLMSGYASGGQMKEACELLNEAKKRHAKLSPATFHTVIRGFCKLGEFDKALALFREMRESGVNPNVDEYNKLIQSLSIEALDWKTATQLYMEMEERGMRVNEATRGLIKAVKELEEERLGSTEA